MGVHESGSTRQLISRPLLTAALTVLLVIALLLAWRGYGERIDDGAATAATCLEGDADVPVVADPALAPALAQIAERYNAARPMVRDHCVRVTVKPVDAKVMLDGLTGPDWDAQAYGAYPAAWVPESSIWSSALSTAAPATLAGTPESLVSSPVRLATEPALAAAAAGDLAWADLPALTRANSLGAFGRGSWGSIRMAMPQGAQSDATALAGQAVAAATVRTTGPLTAAQAASGEVVAAMNALVSAPPRVGDGSAEAAVEAIAGADDPATAPVRAVPITEQRLYLLTKDDATAKVTPVAPKGATPAADYPAIRLGGPQIPEFAADAAAEFLVFARKPEQMKLLTLTGFRGPGPLPEATATVKFGDDSDPLPVPAPAAAVALNRIVLPAAVPGR